MAVETGTDRSAAAAVASENWRAGVVSGLVGGVVFGALMSATSPAVVEVAIPSLYGLAPPANGALGWVVHMSHAAVLGVAYAALVATADIPAGAWTRHASLGVAYGVVLWAVLAVFVMPVWLDAVGSPANPPLPNVDWTSLAGHLAYGVVLAVVYEGLRNV
jgi:hypothetical protein